MLKTIQRKVIQIAIDTSEPGIESDVYALCDDGTIWRNDSEGDWRRFYPVPGTLDEIDQERDVELQEKGV